MKENFTAQQREIVARRMGYNGPMDMFDAYLESTPVDANKYANIVAKMAEKMAKGGVVKKRYFAMGGDVLDTTSGDYTGTDVTSTGSVGALTTGSVGALTTSGVTALNPDQAYIDMYQKVLGKAPDAAGLAYWKSQFGDTIDENELKTFTGTAKDLLTQQAAGGATTANKATYTDQQIIDAIKASRAAGFTDEQIAAGAAVNYNVPADKIAALMGGMGSMDSSGKTVTTSETGAPVMGKAPSYTAAQTATTGQGGTVTQQGATTTATGSQVATTAQAATPGVVSADQITAASSTADVKKFLADLTAAQGTVSEKAQVKAAQQEPTSTAVAGMEGAKGTAATVVAPEERKLQAGETISGTAVDMAQVEQELAKLKAEQGTVTDESTVTGQLNKLMKDFNAGNPPPWAAASMRTAMATLAARGLGASSLAGQAIVQAALEAATPIATTDAAVYQKMNEQNLSNRQAVAVLIGEQRAKFLGQAYDQAYDARVKNAAKISDIANKNFDANVTIALENSRLANSMNIAQLSADNAVALAKIAQVATLETTNLNNRQQAAVENAKAFLAMDLKNLDNTQQTKMIVAQKVTDSIVSDAALTQAARATNATNKLEADKISSQLALSAATFNAGEQNRVAIANSATANDIAKFNATEANNRDQFNAKMASEVSVANAKILAEISTANTAATNAALAVASKNATDLASVEYAQEQQTFRDKLELSWKTGENMLDRATNIATATIAGNAATTAANIKAASDASAAIGKLAGTIVLDWMGIKG